MTLEKIKGCPFCSSDHPEDMTLIEEPSESTEGAKCYYVQCDGCLARGPIIDTQQAVMDTKNETIRQWNDAKRKIQ